jgi:hypothetical protein
MPALPMGGRAFLMCFRTLQEYRENSPVSRGRGEMQGVLRLRLAFRFAERKSSLRMTIDSGYD